MKVKTNALVLLGLMLGVVGRGADQPNIVLIVADDLGYSDAAFTMEYAMMMRTTPGWDTNALAEVMARSGVPKYLRSDNGPEWERSGHRRPKVAGG